MKGGGRAARWWRTVVGVGFLLGLASSWPQLPGGLASHPVAEEIQTSVWDGVYTEAQASRGGPIYRANCTFCHGEDLSGSNELGPPLLGSGFLGPWRGLSIADLMTLITTSMPKDAPGSLTVSEYTDVVAFLLETNGFPAGSAELPAAGTGLGEIQLEALRAATADPQDAPDILQAAAAAMGDPSTVGSIEYSGAGWLAAVGQSHTPGDDWPRFEVAGYTRTIDYDTRFSREAYTRRQGDYPPLGGGMPIQGEQRRVSVTTGGHSWNMNGDQPAPEPAAAEVRQLDIWMSPHGFLKAAAEANDMTAMPVMLQGRDLTIVSFTVMDKYRLNGTINEDNLVERVQTWVPNPIFGDMIYDHRYTEYRDFDGVMFPTVLHSHQGDPRIHPGHNWMEIQVTDVRANADVAALTVPDSVRRATVPPVTVRSTTIAEGVWRIAGGSHHSIAVEFSDFVTVVEAPQREARSLAVIAEVRRLIPDKPIRYVVNTHHHFDHAGGLRTYVAQSATVVTHAANRDFYYDVFFHPGTRALEPDTLSGLMPWFAGNRIPAIEPVSEKYTITDGGRTMDIYPVAGLDHAGTMLIAHLPAERVLINADLYSPRTSTTEPPAANASMRSLHDNIRKLNLDVARHIGIHGLIGSHLEFMKIVDGG